MSEPSATFQVTAYSLLRIPLPPIPLILHKVSSLPFNLSLTVPVKLFFDPPLLNIINLT